MTTDPARHRYNSIVSTHCRPRLGSTLHSSLGRDIDPRDPIFIWNFVFYPDVSISPFVKRGDIKALLERRVSLYSQ